jgi:hypothetical protein
MGTKTVGSPCSRKSRHYKNNTTILPIFSFLSVKAPVIKLQHNNELITMLYGKETGSKMKFFLSNTSIRSGNGLD